MTSVADGLGDWNPWPNNPYPTKTKYQEGEYTPFLPEWLLCSKESLTPENAMWNQNECPNWNTDPRSNLVGDSGPFNNNTVGYPDDPILSDWLY
jgi:hypothetical protein